MHVVFAMTEVGLASILVLDQISQLCVRLFCQTKNALDR